MRVLGLRASHLPLIRTNLGRGTVLTAACTCESRSFSGLVRFGLVILDELSFITMLSCSIINTLSVS
jgi:hypothetical protein